MKTKGKNFVKTSELTGGKICKLGCGFALGIVLLSPPEVNADDYLYDDVYVVNSNSISVDLSVLDEMNTGKRENEEWQKKIYAPSPDARPLKDEKLVKKHKSIKKKQHKKLEKSKQKPAIRTKPRNLLDDKSFEIQGTKSKTDLKAEKKTTLKQPVIATKPVTAEIETKAPLIKSSSSLIDKDVKKDKKEQEKPLTKSVTPKIKKEATPPSKETTNSKLVRKDKDGVPIPQTDKTEPVEVKELASLTTEKQEQSLTTATKVAVAENAKIPEDKSLKLQAPEEKKTEEKKTLVEQTTEPLKTPLKQEKAPSIVPEDKPLPEVIHESDGLMAFNFDKDSLILSSEMTKELNTLLAKMEQDKTLAIRVVSYAKDAEEKSSKARRKSLSRALAVRSFLIDNGVRSTRIEVRALGNKIQQDRLYIEKIKRK